MAKLKKTASKTARKPAAKPALRKTSGRSKKAQPSTPKSITESAQQIWLAGMGAFNRAQAEGSKLFETLVRDGLSLEQTARRFAGARAGAVRGTVEEHVGQARERAVDTWDKLEKVFEDRVQRALTKLGVPGREDLTALTQRVERLTAALRGEKPATAKPARKAAVKKAAKPAAKKAAKPAAEKAVKSPSKAVKAPKPRTKAVKAAKPAPVSAPADQTPDTAA